MLSIYSFSILFLFPPYHRYRRLTRMGPILVGWEKAIMDGWGGWMDGWVWLLFLSLNTSLCCLVAIM
jgi:hypothetical protein